MFTSILLNGPAKRSIADNVSEISPDIAVEDLLLRLLYALATEEFEDGRASSSLFVYFSGILSLKTDGSTFKRPKEYTSLLSALIYCGRLVILEHTLPLAPHRYIGLSCRPRLGQLDKLNLVRREKMCLGAQAPLSECVSLRMYGRVLSQTDGPSFRALWSDDGEVIRWDEHRLSMSEFRALSGDLLERTSKAIDRLMYSWDPGCNLDSITDRMANMEQGYSFVSEPANNLRLAYLELSNRACLPESDGLALETGWDLAAVHRYLTLYDESIVLLLLLIYLVCGQAARVTELLTVEFCNGASTSRGIYIHNGLIALVIRHNKSRHTTNREFQVARFLPAVVSKLVYIHLVFIRPFTNMLRRCCLNSTMANNNLFFASCYKPTGPLETTVLSHELQQTSKRLFGFSIHVRAYRQISIAITEKHIKQIQKPFNIYDDKSPDAPIEVVFAWQSGHRPLQRAVTYGLDGAYPDSLQPALLRAYQWASEQWHHFLQLGTQKTMGTVGSMPCNRQDPDQSNIQPPIYQAWSSGKTMATAKQRGAQNQKTTKILSAITANNQRKRKFSQLAHTDNIVKYQKGLGKGGIEEVAGSSFLYNLQHRVLVCRDCGTCISATSTGHSRHLRALPHRLVGAALKDMITRLDQFRDRCFNLAELRQFKPRDKKYPCVAIQGLDTYKGYYCMCDDHCDYCTRRLPKMQLHISTIHGRRSSQEKTMPPWRECHLQTYFTAKGLIDYFIVVEPTKPLSQSTAR